MTQTFSKKIIKLYKFTATLSSCRNARLPLSREQFKCTPIISWRYFVKFPLLPIMNPTDSSLTTTLQEHFTLSFWIGSYIYFKINIITAFFSMSSTWVDSFSNVSKILVTALEMLLGFPLIYTDLWFIP